MRRFAALASSVLETEMALHREFAARWGVTDLEAVAVEPATAAYCNFLLRDGVSGRLLRARRRGAAVHVDATRRSAPALAPTSDRYREWIDMYASEEFGELAAWARSIVDEVDGDAERMSAAFAASCEHEVRFWDAAYLNRRSGVESSETARAFGSSERSRSRFL